jgi:aminopeptidase
MPVVITKKHLQIWADYLLNYSLGGIKSDDIVMVKGEHICWPLLSILQNKIFAAGAIVDINLVPPDNDRGKVWGASMAKFGSVEQIKRVPAWQEERYNKMTKYIEILGAESPELFRNLPGDKLQAIMKADEPLKIIRLSKPWVLTLYPTPGFAELEEMSLKEYAAIIVKASIQDPRQLEKVEENIYQVMKKSRSIRIITQPPLNRKNLELQMDITDRNIIKCTGKNNFPDGEVFTSPDANSVEGEIYVDLPVFYSGTTIQGIYLRFQGGVIKDYRARWGMEALRKIIETDAGSHRLGEVALGMNQGIQKVLKHPLFVEKVGGTLHIAIGSSYPESYVTDSATAEGKKSLELYLQKGIMNKSAQHVDIVTDFRPGGAGRAVYLDSIKLAVKNKLWVVPPQK